MPLRLILALALSSALHSVLLLPGLLKRFPVAPPRPALQALLHLPPQPETPAAEPLLKNTLDPEDAPQADKPPPPSTPEHKPRARREAQLAQKKLSEHLFYPPEAVARGLEGEVRLILRLSPEGTIDDISIAASSGHILLDNAAIKAAYAMGKLTGVTSRELILPVIFRLQ